MTILTTHGKLLEKKTMRVGTNRFICAGEYIAEFTRIRWLSCIIDGVTNGRISVVELIIDPVTI